MFQKHNFNYNFQAHDVNDGMSILKVIYSTITLKHRKHLPAITGIIVYSYSIL